MPLEITPDGVDAEFLWLAAGRGASRGVWEEFPGIYACFPTDDAKAGATVYARVARPGAAASEPRRVFLAGQPYCSGSVLYAGSSELWRLGSSTMLPTNGSCPSSCGMFRRGGLCEALDGRGCWLIAIAIRSVEACRCGWRCLMKKCWPPLLPAPRPAAPWARLAVSCRLP